MQLLNCDVCLEISVVKVEAERRKMTTIKSLSSVLILLLFPLIIGLDVQAQPQPNRNNARQVGTNRLTGTFRLDSSRSDNPRDKAQRATQNLGS